MNARLGPWWLYLVLALCPSLVYASGIDSAASQIFGLTEMAGAIMRMICLITGGALLMGTLFKYKKYRKNPIEVKLSSVFVMLLTSLALIALYFVPMFAGT